MGLDNNSDFEPISVYSDSFGKLLEVATCEYCQRTMPIHVHVHVCGNGRIEDDKGKGKETYNTLLRSYDYKGRLIWRCNECAVDIKNKIK